MSVRLSVVLLLLASVVTADFASGRLNQGEVYPPLFSGAYYTTYKLPLGTQYRTFVPTGSPNTFDVLLQNDRCVGGVHCNDPTEYLQQLAVTVSITNNQLHLTTVRSTSVAGADYGVFLYNTDALLIDGGSAFVTCSSTDAALPLRTQKLIKVGLPSLTKQADYIPPVVGTQFKTKMIAYDGSQTVWAIERANTLSIFNLNLNKLGQIVHPYLFYVCTCITYEPNLKRLYLSGQILQGGEWSITTIDILSAKLYNTPLPANVGNRLIRDVSFDATTGTMFVTAQAITMNLPSLQKGQLTMYTYKYTAENFDLVPQLENSWMAGYFSGFLPSKDFYYLYDMLGMVTKIRKSDITPVITATITVTGPLCRTPVFNCPDAYPPVTNSRFLQPYYRAGALLNETTAVFGGDWHGSITIVHLDKLCDDADSACHPPCSSHSYLA